MNNAGGWNPRPLMETSEKALEAAFRFNVTVGVLADEARGPAPGGERHGERRQHLVARGEHGAALLHRLRRGEGGAVDDDARDGTRARAEDPGERDRGRWRRDRCARRTCSPTRRSGSGSSRTRRCGGSARPDDIAACVVYLASDAAAWVTGKVFEVDGGVEAPAFTVPFEPI